MKQTDSTNQYGDERDTAGHEYLIFRLGEEEYGIDILKVQEIRSCERVTRIANSPDFISGVTNLRGVIVPIVDLRVKFSLRSALFEDNAVVIVLNFGYRVIGIIVDGVSDVMTLAERQIRPAPEFSVMLSTEYLQGLGSVDDRMIVLVDIEKLLNSEEMELVEQSMSLADGS
ncbi:chemotaxis protein CheW [Pantoea sp. KPR_PJ]|uniref:chemotaxis protein CheW n=1 Tax=Pantoea sp. KPR_PJ TaxID=2738375 RepID=UPI00352753C0